MSEKDWRDALIAAARHDIETRTRLAQTGELFQGYHPEMEAVHNANADLLGRVMADIGWPGRHKLGDEGADDRVELLGVLHAERVGSVARVLDEVSAADRTEDALGHLLRRRGEADILSIPGAIGVAGRGVGRAALCGSTR